MTPELLVAVREAVIKRMRKQPWAMGNPRADQRETELRSGFWDGIGEMRDVQYGAEAAAEFYAPIIAALTAERDDALALIVDLEHALARMANIQTSPPTLPEGGFDAPR